MTVNNPAMDQTVKRVSERLKERGMTWGDISRHLGISDQRAYNWRKRGIPKNQIAAIAEFLGCTIDWLLTGKPALPRDINIGGTAKRGFEDRGSDELEFIGHIDAWDSDTPLSPDEVELPLFREVEFSAGAGQTQVQENHGPKLRFAKSTLARQNVAPENAACASIKGNSMDPVMPDGTTVGIDKGTTEIRDGKAYAVDHDGMLRVKYLYRKPGGGLLIRSQNQQEHPDEHYTMADIQEQNIRIIGRVFWWSVLP